MTVIQFIKAEGEVDMNIKRLQIDVNTVILIFHNKKQIKVWTAITIYKINRTEYTFIQREFFQRSSNFIQRSIQRVYHAVRLMRFCYCLFLSICQFLFFISVPLRHNELSLITR